MNQDDPTNKKLFGWISWEMVAQTVAALLAGLWAFTSLKSDVRDVNTRGDEFRITVIERISAIENSQVRLQALEVQQAVIRADVQTIKEGIVEQKADIKKLLQRTPP